MSQQIKLPDVKLHVNQFVGGLDTVTPQDNIRSGMVIKAVNFEANITGGYRRINGFQKVIAAQVPGTGSVLGVWYYKGDVYAIRNNGSGIAVIYRGNIIAGTWTALPTYQVLTYTAGIFSEGSVVVGDTLTGKSSGTVGTIKKFIKYAGSYGTDAQGYMVIQVTSGSGYTIGEPIEKTAGNMNVVSGTSIGTATSQHACGVLPDGHVIKCGGYTTAAISGVEYATISGNTITWAATTSLPVARYQHTLTVLSTGALLVVGGLTPAGATFTTCIGNIAGTSINWLDATPLLAARYNHTTTLLADGRVLVTGGRDPNGGACIEAAIGTVTGTKIDWIQTDSLPDYLYGHTINLLGDGRLLLCGGKNNTTIKANAYIGTINGNSLTWQAVASMPVPLYEHGAVPFSGIYGIVIGGKTTGESTVSTTYLGAISGNTVTWTAGGSLPAVLCYQATVQLKDGRPMTVGGKTTSDANTTAVYMGSVNGGVIMLAQYNSAPIQLAANGNNKFRFVNHNFYSSTDTFNMYLCDGVNPACEWDGSVLTPILMPTLPNAPFNNAPKVIAAHNGYLWLGFAKGSLQKSVIGDPLNWSGFLGAAEYGLGHEITDLVPMLDTSLMIGTEQNIQVMQGTNETDFALKLLSANTACIPNTAKVSVRPMIGTMKGIMRLDSTQSYGDFQSNSVSRMIDSLLIGWASTKQLIGASIARTKNQYRLYFTDGTGIVLTQDALYADQNLPAFTTFNYGKTISCIASVSDDTNVEMSLFGDSTGYVYREFIGNSFDGAAIPALLVTPFLNLGAKSLRKSFKRIEFDIENSGTSDLTMSYCLSEGQPHTFKNVADTLITAAGSATWNESNWNGETVTIPIADQQIISMTGTGHSIAFAFSSNSATVPAFTISNLSISYIPRRANRG